MSTEGHVFDAEIVDGSHAVAVAPKQETQVDILRVIEKRNELLDKIKGFALKATHSGHWSAQGDKPYLGAAGSEVVARRCAVKIRSVRFKKVPSSDDKGEFYIYFYEGVFSLPGGFDEVEAVGTCSSRDTFLGTETKAGRPLSEIDEGNIAKAAYSNLMVNGVQRLLGLRGMTWEQLAAFGIERGGVAKVEFASGARGGSQDRGIIFKFGKCKDKSSSEVADADLRWYADAFRRDLADASKEKYHAGTKKQLATIEAEIASRGAPKPTAAPAASTATAAPAGPSVWARIQELGKVYGVDEAGLKGAIKAATGKVNAKDLAEADVVLVENALTALSAVEADDILQ